MDRIELQVTKQRLDEDKHLYHESSMSFWSLVLDDEYGIPGLIMGLITMIFGITLVVAVCEGRTNLIAGLTVATFLCLAVFMLASIKAIARNNAYQRWCYIRRSVFGKPLRDLEQARRLIEKNSSRIAFSEFRSRLNDLDKVYWEVWHSAHLALGLVIDEPESVGRAKELLESAQNLIQERQQAVRELGLGS